MTDREIGSHDVAAISPSGVFGIFWGILFAGNFLVAGPWMGFHGLFLGSIGLLMWWRPPVVALPRVWWIFAMVFGVGCGAAFLPVGWIGSPPWRAHLEAIGVQTGGQVAIQARQAAESVGLILITLLIGLWLAGQRASAGQLRRWALAFTVGVAGYAIAARLVLDVPHAGQAAGHFGFFPNRNHSATYLAMGTICGLGCTLQALRDRRMPAMVVALVATAVCLWAVAGWSISRAGVVLVASGVGVWLAMLGPRYLGRNGGRVLALIALAGGGLFFIADSGVKDRIAKTAEKAGTVWAKPTEPDATGQAKPDITSSHELDFRIPTALDTLDLIRDFKWTGIGAGQYIYVFPQYRNRTAVANDSDNHHPESDWLWMTAETGIPATLALAALVAAAAWWAGRDIRNGRDRAVRAGCLAAALLVPLHGLFDVPGHRITLALGAAFLFALSLRTEVGKPFSKWSSRVVATGIITIAAFLIVAQWFGGPPPALAAADTALAQARQLYAEDRALQLTPQANSVPGQPDGDEEDLLEKGLEILANAETIAPLDRSVRRYQGFLALHFDDLLETVHRSYEIERELDPTWIDAPLQQALSWSNKNLDETRMLWSEAIRRAKSLDHRNHRDSVFENRTHAKIREQGRANPALERLWTELPIE